MVFTKKMKPETSETAMQRQPVFHNGFLKQSSFFLALTILAMTLFTLPATTVFAEEGDEETTRSLDFADFKTTEDGGVEIRLAFSDAPPTPTGQGQIADHR